MNDAEMANGGTEKVVALHKQIVALSEASGASMKQAVMACLISAVTVNRADGECSHAELVELLRTMETLPGGRA